MANKTITITLSDANAWELELVSTILKKSKSEIISSCLKGSTNPRSRIKGKNIFSV